ncbi:hypothetical protein RvY_18618-2 [Ramazzottius varieornatus]|uniref:Uncharacterized protein n=1 Tax=Ramazzottius varieornatus TaxID=947166 RepID=A0A1D1W6F5_RAMVA|nr:hypothetical protein RvY_18618-2 [Ramazzottius varieornatus]
MLSLTSYRRLLQNCCPSSLICLNFPETLSIHVQLKLENYYLLKFASAVTSRLQSVKLQYLNFFVAPGPHAIPTPQPGLPPPNAHPPGFPSTQQHYYAPQPLTSASIFIPSPANVTIDPKLVGPPPPTAASQSQAPLSNMYNSISNRPPSNMYNNSMFEPSGMSDNTAYTAMESQRDLRATSIGPDGVVPGRLTDTEIRVKVNGDLPLWYMQEKPKVAKYTKHMLHLFGTGVCVLVSFLCFGLLS